MVCVTFESSQFGPGKKTAVQKFAEAFRSKAAPFDIDRQLLVLAVGHSWHCKHHLEAKVLVGADSMSSPETVKYLGPLALVVVLGVSGAGAVECRRQLAEILAVTTAEHDAMKAQYATTEIWVADPCLNEASRFPAMEMC